MTAASGQYGLTARLPGLAIPRSTLAQWVGTCGVRLQPLVDALKAEVLTRRVLHADETPVQMLKPGKGTTHRAYLWAYAPGAFEDMKAVVYDFCESRAGEHARNFLGDWRGSLVCDDFSGYKAGFANGITEAGCLAHARRKFFDLHAANKSQIAGFALEQFAKVYDIEREVKDLNAEQRTGVRQQRTQPLLDVLHQWMSLQRQKMPDSSATARALDYSLRRWVALTRFAGDGQLSVDNNWIENQIRPIAIGRNNWLFAGSLRAGPRAGCGDEPGAVGPHERARPLCLSQGCTHAAAHTQGQPDRGVAAASLAERRQHQRLSVKHALRWPSTWVRRALTFIASLRQHVPESYLQTQKMLVRGRPLFSFSGLIWLFPMVCSLSALSDENKSFFDRYSAINLKFLIFSLSL